MSTCLYFIHVVKTGGTSLRKFFNDNDTNLKFYTGPTTSFGHNSYSLEEVDMLKVKYDNIITAIALRDPVKQLASFYSYAHINSTSLMYKTIENKTFSEWIRSVPDFENYYIKFLNFIGCYDPNGINNFEHTNCNYEKASDILRSIDYVIDTDHLTMTFNDLLSDVEETVIFDIYSNISHSDQMVISEEDRSYIKEIRAKDYKLLNEFNIGVD